MGVTFHDNTKAVINQMESNLARAAVAVGVQGVGCVVRQMQSGYGKPIRQTGNLMQSINAHIESSGKSAVITIGTNVEYAPFVHYGARGRAGRPFLTDGIERNKDVLFATAEAYLKL